MKVFFLALVLVCSNVAAQTQQDGVDVRKSRLLLLPASTVECGQPPQFLSTHPSHETRIREIEANLPRVLPLYGKQP